MSFTAFSPARARPFSNSQLSALWRRLSGEIGSESAKLELKWMREELRARRTAGVPTISSPPRANGLEWELGELSKMVDRRLKGEPLQYVLGGCSLNFMPGLGFETTQSVAAASSGIWSSLKQQRDSDGPPRVYPLLQPLVLIIAEVM